MVTTFIAMNHELYTCKCSISDVTSRHENVKLTMILFPVVKQGLTMLR